MGQAIVEKFKYRESTEKLNNIDEIMEVIKESDALKEHWKNYHSKFSYAKDISYEYIMEVLEKNNSIQYFSNDVLENYLIEEEMDTIKNMNLYHVLNDFEELDMKFIIYKFIYGFNTTEISRFFGCCTQTVTRKIKHWK